MTAYEKGFFLGVAHKEKELYNCGEALKLNSYATMSHDWLEFNRGWKDAY